MLIEAMSVLAGDPARRQHQEQLLSATPTDYCRNPAIRGHMRFCGRTWSKPCKMWHFSLVERGLGLRLF